MSVQFVIYGFLLITFIAKTNAETLKQRLLRNDLPCKAHQFRCHNSQCIDGHLVCDGSKNCNDGSDETSCSEYRSDCVGYRSFACKGSRYYKCFPSSFVCNGIQECWDPNDESHCGGRLETSVQGSDLHRRKLFAQRWVHGLRRGNQPIRKWGAEVRRIAVALYLSNDKTFHKDNALRDELGNELSVNLMSRMILKSNIAGISNTELASYINAFLVTCIDPRKFFVVDLVRELRRRVDGLSHPLPYVMLALCNAGDKMTERDVEKINSFFWAAHRKFKTDMQALSILALECAARQPDPNTEFAEIGELVLKLKAAQFKNGTYETLKTSALVLQALMATATDTDEENFNSMEAIRQILLAQREDGSFGSTIDTCSVLPVLDYHTLADIGSSHCPTIAEEEKETIHDLENKIGTRWTIDLSLWIGNNRTVERTLTLRVPANISFEQLMEWEEKLGKFKFVFSMRDGKPYIYSIYGIQNDAEEGMYWFLFLKSKGAEEHLKPINPADLMPQDNQHLVFWYKCDPWTDEVGRDP